jgi:outer membrane protein assembly factor BamB
VAKATTVIIIAILTASIVFIALQVQPVEAQLAAAQPVSGPLPAGVTPDISAETRASLSFRPNPIGVGQGLLVNMWIVPALASNDRLIPKGFVLTITKPDGTKDVRTLDSEPATAATWFEYTPDQVGTWKIKFDFLGTYFPAGRYYNGVVVTNSSGTAYGSAYYRPSSTGEQTLTVQSDLVWSWPPAPLPTDYWTRPASLRNREWWPILGNWPGTGYQGGGPMWDQMYPDTNPSYSTNYGFTPWVQGPNTAHVVWKRQGAIAGLTGGPAGIYGTTSSPGTPSLIYAGRCYQTVTKANGTSVAQCYDLRTGEIYYEIPGGVTPSLIAYLNPVASSTTIAGNELGSASWSAELLSLSGSYLMKVNPYTGVITGNYSIAPLSMTGGIQAPGGGVYYNQIGGYVLTIQDLGAAAGAQRYCLINWTTRGSSSTIASRIVSNITLDWPMGIGIGGFIVSTPSGGGSIHVDFSASIAGFVGKDERPVSGLMMGTNVSAYSMKTGKQLWPNVWLGDISTYSPMVVVADHGKIAFQVQQGGYFMCYDLSTGKLAWKSEQPDYPWSWNAFGAYSIQSAYGMFFREAYDGVYAFNWTNGKIVWHYKAPALANFESPYIDNGTEVYSFNAGGIIADGKMYVPNTEHTPTWPLTRGWGLHCINITTGDLIWKVNDPMTPGAIADGYLVAANSNDGFMYVFGKGKSATTITAPDVSVPLGTSFTIKGTVMDLSPAQPDTPCVSKNSMTTQMEYLHLQQSISGLWHNETITGVPVTLTAISLNGTSVDLGTITTDGYYGTFSKTWTPTSEGDYKIIASFTGDDSYGSSAAATAVSVGPAPAAIQFPEQTTPPDYTMTIISAAVAIIIAFAVGIALAILLLRKRA